MVKQLENTEVPETYSGEFECVVTREDAEGTWYFEDKLLSPSGKYIMISRRGRHSLSVKDVKKEDQGKYTFKVGEFTTTASLKMKCKSLFTLQIRDIYFDHFFLLSWSLTLPCFLSFFWLPFLNTFVFMS